MGNISDLEALLRPPAMDMPVYPPKAITLASGETMVVRQVAREEVPTLLEAIYPDQIMLRFARGAIVDREMEHPLKGLTSSDLRVDEDVLIADEGETREGGLS